MERITRYFPDLSETQLGQLAQLEALYTEWNAKVNVISRKDIENLYEHHVLHSLAIAKFLSFSNGNRILDVGTGGGFPGIPLAIVFPDVQFVLIDSIGKKIRVAQEVADAIGLKNVTLFHENAKDEKGKYDFVVSRAVMTAPDLVDLVYKNVHVHKNNSLPNGLICLKGGELVEEGVAAWQRLNQRRQASRQGTLFNKRKYRIEDISQWFEGTFFETKKILYVPFC